MTVIASPKTDLGQVLVAQTVQCGSLKQWPFFSSFSSTRVRGMHWKGVTTMVSS